MAPLLAAFRDNHPEVEVFLHTSDGYLNLIEAGYDLAVRFGVLPDSSLSQRVVAPNQRIICASPDYLALRGVPETPQALADHEAIVFGTPPLRVWRFGDGQAVTVRGAFSTSDGERARDWALEGRGLILKSVWDVADDLSTGQLVRVLEAYPLPESAVSAVYPHRRYVAARVRRFVDFLKAELAAQAGQLGL